MSNWDDWIGREDIRHDHIDPAAVTRWLATLDRAAPADGSVPQAYHWCLGLPDAPTAILGADGHPVREASGNSFLPPIPLPRRMWAASKVEFLRPLRPGQSVVRSSRVAAITEKQGGSGKLVFALRKERGSLDDRPRFGLRMEKLTGDVDHHSAHAGDDLVAEQRLVLVGQQVAQDRRGGGNHRVALRELVAQQRFDRFDAPLSLCRAHHRQRFTRSGLNPRYPRRSAARETAALSALVRSP